MVLMMYPIHSHSNLLCSPFKPQNQKTNISREFSLAEFYFPAGLMQQKTPKYIKKKYQKHKKQRKIHILHNLLYSIHFNTYLMFMFVTFCLSISAAEPRKIKYFHGTLELLRAITKGWLIIKLQCQQVQPPESEQLQNIFKYTKNWYSFLK